jgi:alkanesulfonate monooxygenase SsuD/methylene tetrahydromethanopterin reductase-like flavin-dependent oxidoreductase (luciferase family)
VLNDLEFGLLLPHFTAHASRETIFESAKRADGYGFDSLWVRDHLFISPDHREHGGISDPGFVTEAPLTLGALTGVTSHVRLGSAVVTPHRNGLKVAQLFSTLDYLSGGRTILGIGAGWDAHEFASVGLPFDKRLQMVRETVEICRLAWGKDDFSYDGEVFKIPWASVNPQPVSHIPIWYGGLSFKAVELAIELGEGWIPSRLPYDRLRDRIEHGRKLLGSPDRVTDFTFAAMPQTSIGGDVEEALTYFNVDKVLEEALHRKPVSGGRKSMSLEDLSGYLIYGAGPDICRAVERFADLGVTHVVFDMRSSFGRLWENLRVLGEEVLPQFKDR